MARRPARDPSPGGAIAVEILDDDHPDHDDVAGGVPAATTTGPTAAAGTRPPRRRWLVAAGALVLVALVAAANLAELRARDDRRAALAGTPGLLQPVASPVTELWRLEDDGTFAGTVADVVLLSRRDVGTVAGIDSATGEERWVLDAAPGTPWVEQTCRPVAAMVRHEGGPGLTRPADIDPDDDRVLCVRTAVPPAPPPVIADPMLVLDGPSGEVLSAVGGRAAVLTAAVVEGDLLLLQVDTARHLHVSRWDDLSGAEEWRWSSPEPMFSPGYLFLTDLRRHGDLLVAEGLTTTVLDLRTGTAVDVVPPARGSAVERSGVALPGGRTAVWETRESPALARGHVESPSGEVLLGLPAPAVAPPVDDGSVPEVVVVGPVDGAALVGLDAATGERRWTTELGGEGAVTPLVRVDGVLVVVRGDRVHAVAVGTGRTLWDAPAHPAFPQAGLSDGDHVVVVRAEDRARHLVAHDLSDGAVVWRTELPADVQALQVTRAGGLLLVGDGDVVGLG